MNIGSPLETEAVRARKRIVEAEIQGFKSGREAVRIGNTIDMMLREALPDYKLEQAIGSRETKCAITLDWIGDTVLKIDFLDIKSHNAAEYVVQQINYVVERYARDTGQDIRVKRLEVRGKPQPQFINVDYLPKTSVVHNT